MTAMDKDTYHIIDAHELGTSLMHQPGHTWVAHTVTVTLFQMKNRVEGAFEFG